MNHQSTKVAKNLSEIFIQPYTLDKFVTSNSMNLFIFVLTIHMSFLSTDPDTKVSHESYSVAKRHLATLIDVKDTAEKDVALIHECNKTFEGTN